MQRQPKLAGRDGAVAEQQQGCGCAHDGAGHDIAPAFQGIEYPAPDPLAVPAIEPVVDRRVGPVLGWAVAPPGARANHVHDAADDPPDGSLIMQDTALAA